MLKLDLVQTLACAGVILFAGYGIKRLIPALIHYNIPTPVAGALPVACLLSLAYARGWQPLAFDTTLQVPLQNAFFTSVGFGASLSVLRRGGRLVAIFTVLATVVVVLQNAAGAVAAAAMGQHPLMGVLAGSVTMTGGPATGLAFAPLFEAAGVSGAATLALAAAMAGIVAGGLLGGPVATYVFRRLQIERSSLEIGRPLSEPAATLANVAEPQFQELPVRTPPDEDVETYGLTKHIVVILAAMWIGGWLSVWIAKTGFTLPAYIGAMIVAAVIRNVADATGALRLSQRTIDDLGGVALALFLAMALMTLRLWELAGLFLPLVVILAVQIALVALVGILVVPRLMGRDYDAVVMSSGSCGFMLGTTANAMANMGALVERYGPAPRAYLVVPVVGAFFIDFINALVVTVTINLLR